MKKADLFSWAIGAALLFRLFFLVIFWEQPPVIVDEQHYNAIAANLIENGTFALHTDKPTAIRPPLYPFFIAAAYSLTGVDNYNCIRLLQIALSLATAAFLHAVSRRLLGSKEARLAVGAFLLYPSLLVYNFLILSETLFNFFFVGSLLFTCFALYEKKSRYFIGIGICLGLASLTRSITYPMMPLLALFLLFTASGNFMSRLKNISFMLFFFALVLTPWIVRNYNLFGKFIPVDTMGGLNLYMGNYEHTPLHRAWATVGVRGEEAWFAGKEDVLRPMNEAEKQKWAIDRGMQFIRSHPFLTAKRSIIKTANFWGIERSIIAGANGQRPDTIQVLTPSTIKYPLGLYIVVSYACLMLFGFFGLVWKTIYEPSRINIAIAGIILYFTAMHALVFGHPRYHFPLIPLLCVYGAAALDIIPRFWNTRKKQLLGLVGCVFSFFFAIWAYEILLGSKSQLIKLLSFLRS